MNEQINTHMQTSIGINYTNMNRCTDILKYKRHKRLMRMKFVQKTVNWNKKKYAATKRNVRELNVCLTRLRLLSLRWCN